MFCKYCDIKNDNFDIYTIVKIQETESQRVQRLINTITEIMFYLLQHINMGL